MKGIMCGTLVPEKYETRIPQLSNAANRFLLNFLGEIRRKDDIRFISYLGMNIDDEIKKELSFDNDVQQYCFGSFNKIKSTWQYHKTIWGLMDDADYIITYNVIYAWGLVPILAKLKKKKSVLILADYSPTNSFKNFLKKAYARIQYILIQKYDIVVGLSENTKNYLKKTQRFICIEGGISPCVYDYFDDDTDISTSHTVRFMYAGILEKVTGIDMLLRAFSDNSSDNVELWISGKGSYEDHIKKMSAQDNRIKYLGCVPYEEYLSNLKKADVLVNPRNMEMPENFNNFPSKIMEYLATGKKIISTKFPGWERFNENILFCESSVDDLKRAMNQIITMDHSFSKQRKFAEKYLWCNQVEKLVAEMNSIRS